MKKSKQGFTLVEMMLVIAIIVVLAGTALVGIGDSLKRSKDQQEKFDEHALLLDAASRDVRLMMHVNPPPAIPASTEKNSENTPAGIGGGTPGGGGSPVNGGNAPSFEETTPEETTVPEETTAPEETTVPEETTTGGSTTGGSTTGGSTTGGSTSSESTDISIHSDKNGTVTLSTSNQYDLQSNISVSANSGKTIKSVVITAPSGITLTSVNSYVANGYAASMDDGKIVITYTPQSWTSPLQNLNVNNIKWEGTMSCELTYDIEYN